VTHTLLLADDSVTIQRVIELTFADEDVQVVAVSDGDQAIARLESAPPDIVLADIGMPGKNGYEVARYVKQSPKLSHIPVVLLTGAFEPVDQALASMPNHPHRWPTRSIVTSPSIRPGPCPNCICPRSRRPPRLRRRRPNPSRWPRCHRWRSRLRLPLRRLSRHR
jgi:CheY-like chemotaxis protein